MEVLLESAGVPRYAVVDQGLHGRVADAARGRLGEQAWQEAKNEGRAMSFEEVVSFVFEGDPAPG